MTQPNMIEHVYKYTLSMNLKFVLSDTNENGIRELHFEK